MKTSFNNAVVYVHHTYFPTWDKKGRWKVVQARDLDGAQGRCEPETRTTSILRGIMGDDLHRLLVHEMCHAVAGPHHGQRWRQRMEMAARRAEELGNVILGGLVREELDAYKDAYVPSAASVYGDITDAVGNGATFIQVIDLVRRDVGMSRDQFLKRFRRAERVYDEAVAEGKEEAELRAKWLAGGV